MNIDRDQIKAIVREVLVELFLSNQSESEQWMDLNKAWQPLGYPSYSKLYKDIQKGLFRKGKEVCDRRTPGAENAKLQIDIVAARKRLQEDPSKRRGV